MVTAPCRTHETDMAEEGRVHSYLAAKMLSMDFGERVEEADRLWNGTGKKHQENETGE